jgi:hypothetical protein
MIGADDIHEKNLSGLIDVPLVLEDVPRGLKP